MSESWLNLEGKTVIVTGGASGIGKAVAQGFLNAGSNVVISDMAPEAPEMDEAAGKLLYVKTDVTKVADVEAMVEKAKETFGTIDVLVNNAGINIPRLLVDPKDPKGQYELDEAVWDKVCNVNLKGVFFCAQAVGRVEKVVYELRADLHKAMNDQLRWVIGTQIAVTGLAIAAFKLL